MNPEIKNGFTGKVIIENGKYSSIREACEENRTNLAGAYLYKANLNCADLRGADLWQADLRGAYLSNADLRGASLSNADINGADLGDANLTGASLRYSNLHGAFLHGADLYGADIQGADLWRAFLHRANLYGAKNYYTSHDFFTELIRREPLETFTDEEWVMIGQIITHNMCWGAIKKRFGKKILRIGKILAEKGFDEYLNHYKERE